MFTTGQRVVCIDDKWGNYIFENLAGCKKGSTHEVTKVTYIDDKTYLELDGADCWYWEKRFALVQPRRASIDAEVFTAYDVVEETLAPVKTKEVANA